MKYISARYKDFPNWYDRRGPDRTRWGTQRGTDAISPDHCGGQKGAWSFDGGAKGSPLNSCPPAGTAVRMTTRTHWCSSCTRTIACATWRSQERDRHRTALPSPRRGRIPSRRRSIWPATKSSSSVTCHRRDTFYHRGPWVQARPVPACTCRRLLCGGALWGARAKHASLCVHPSPRCMQPGGAPHPYTSTYAESADGFWRGVWCSKPRRARALMDPPGNHTE